jgi:hypothetical protein
MSNYADLVPVGPIGLAQGLDQWYHGPMAVIKLVLQDQELDDIDRVRGAIPRERWIRDLAHAAIVARDAFDGPCWLRIKATERNGPEREGVHMFIPLDD